MKKRSSNPVLKAQAKLVSSLEDAWAVQKAKIEELAAEQARADIALVEAKRAHDQAKKALDNAVSRKTTAEKKLNAYRAQLGAE